MNINPTDKNLAEMVSDLSEALNIFSSEAAKLTLILARSGAPASPEGRDEVRKQGIAEISAFDEYMNRKEEIFAYLRVQSR